MRARLTAVTILAVLGLAGCGSSSRPAPPASAPPAATTPAAAVAAAAPAPVCRHVPRRTVRVIASHGNPKTRFAAGAAAAIRVPSGYAVTVPSVAGAGGTRRMATWFVDRLRAPQTVTSGNTAALSITNWPLDALDSEPVRESQLCATRRLRGPGPLAR